MICYNCGGDMIETMTTYFEQLESTIVIIKNVPCHKCKQCGEESFSFEVTERLEKIIDGFKESLTEVAIVNYSAA